MFTTSEIIPGLCDSDSNTGLALRWLEFGNVVVWMYLSDRTYTTPTLSGDLYHYGWRNICMLSENFQHVS